MSKDKVTCVTGDLLEGCTTSSLSFLVDGGYMAPDIISFVQDTFCEGFIGKANLPTVVHIHDDSCGLPFSDVLENLFYPLGVGLMANYCSIVNIACNHNDLRDSIEYNKDWPSRTTAHNPMQFAFRSEFRPLDILQLIFSPVSHSYRGNTTNFDGFCLAVALFWFCCLGWFLGLRFGFWFLVLCLFSINM